LSARNGENGGVNSATVIGRGLVKWDKGIDGRLSRKPSRSQKKQTNRKGEKEKEDSLDVGKRRILLRKKPRDPSAERPTPQRETKPDDRG